MTEKKPDELTLTRMACVRLQEENEVLKETIERMREETLEAWSTWHLWKSEMLKLEARIAALEHGRIFGK
jgi:hypothetical protein